MRIVRLVALAADDPIDASETVLGCKAEAELHHSSKKAAH
jgi:hypothetical protein